MTVGKRIVELRQARGLNQTELAKLAGISKSGLSELENGIRTGNVKTLEKIAKALKVKMEDLF